LEWPIKEFGSLVSECWFVERTGGFGNKGKARRLLPDCRLEFFAEDARLVFPRCGEIKVFVFKRDSEVDGEGSSGIMWFAQPLLEEVLAKLSDDALVVTDGSNCRLEGLRTHRRSDAAPGAPLPEPFTHGRQRFESVRCLTEVRGPRPVFVWKVTRQRISKP
jgi:hypothetical protein